MDRALVLNIQKFSLHDGDGIRTTVFFKGCSLRCLWCHNPESQSFKPQLMVYKERCTKCGDCVEACPRDALSIKEDEDGELVLDRDKCDASAVCVDVCAYDALEIAGKYYTAEELVAELKKDLILYEESGGGVTLSGGEVMNQSADFLLDLVKRLKRIGINIAIDTSGHAKWEGIEKISPYVDTFLYDIKTLDKEKHSEYIGGDLDLILTNLKKLNDLDTRIDIRIPVIGKVNDSPEEMEEIAKWLVDNKIGVTNVNLLPYHATGSSKYDRLGLEYEDDRVSVPEEEKMEKFKSIFKEYGFENTHIGG